MLSSTDRVEEVTTRAGLRMSRERHSGDEESVRAPDRNDLYLFTCFYVSRVIGTESTLHLEKEQLERKIVDFLAVRINVIEDLIDAIESIVKGSMRFLSNETVSLEMYVN